MDFTAKRKFIFDQIRMRVRVAVETDGFQCEDKPAMVFDAYESTNSLSNLSRVEELVGKYSTNTPENFKGILLSIENIKKALLDYSDKLARNAEIGNVELNEVDPKIFDKRYFKMLWTERS